MAASEHTPGPWYAEEQANGEWHIIQDRGDDSDGWVATVGAANGEADAALIADAPQLLVALEALYEAALLATYPTEAVMEACAIALASARRK